MEETNAPLADGGNVIETVTIEWRRSDCCFAKVTQNLEVYQMNTNVNAEDEMGRAVWAGVTFICNSCNADCATYVSPPLARFAAKEAGKEIEDDA